MCALISHHVLFEDFLDLIVVIHFLLVHVEVPEIGTSTSFLIIVLVLRVCDNS